MMPHDPGPGDAAFARAPARTPRGRDDRGETMLMTTVLISFLLLASWALISGSQQWGARRDVQAAASAAARAGAQPSPEEIRGGVLVLDPGLVAGRVGQVLARSGYSGGVIAIDSGRVVVSASGSVDYAFPAPGFPGSLTATASSTATQGVQGDEGG